MATKKMRVGCLRCHWRGVRSADPFAQCPTCGMPCHSMAEIKEIRHPRRVMETEHNAKSLMEIYLENGGNADVARVFQQARLGES